MKKYIVIWSAFLLMGCESGVEDSSKIKTAEAANYFYKNAIYLPDGAGIMFSGKLRNYTLVSSKKGSFDRYILEFSEDMMAVEGAVFATLAKSGYQRKIRREDDRLFVVSYIKNGFVPVSMTYERVPAKKEVEALTRLKIIWQNALKN